MKRPCDGHAALRGFRVHSRRELILNNGVSGDNCGSPQQPHNDQNRTTPGTNLLPSINHARVKRAFRLKRKCFVCNAMLKNAGRGWVVAK